MCRRGNKLTEKSDTYLPNTEPQDGSFLCLLWCSRYPYTLFWVNSMYFFVPQTSNIESVCDEKSFLWFTRTGNMSYIVWLLEHFCQPKSLTHTSHLCVVIIAVQVIVSYCSFTALYFREPNFFLPLSFKLVKNCSLTYFIEIGTEKGNFLSCWQSVIPAIFLFPMLCMHCWLQLDRCWINFAVDPYFGKLAIW